MARCLEVEVTSQGDTLEQALENLREALDGRTVIVPMHRQLKRPTLASLLRQARMTAEQLGLR